MTLLQQQPPTSSGSFYYVFEHLAAAEIEDPSAVTKMTAEQHVVFSIGMLRQEVNSGGFDSYFLYTGGNTALAARDSVAILGHEWQSLVSEACEVFGDSYPTDIGAREAAVHELNERDPEALNRLDSKFYELEADQPADDLLDAYVWAHRDGFFT